MRDKVNEELKRLEKEDIIKGVTGKTTPWLNPLLIVPTGEQRSEFVSICVLQIKLLQEHDTLFLRSTICL